jgi:hypothetical protein
MAELILELNDTNLRLWSGTELALESPGFARLKGRDFEFGETARDEARLHPRDINHRFWWQLNTDPLRPEFGQARHSADLVHAHLLQIHQASGSPQAMVLAAPGSLQQDQLSLLLGIIQACPFEASGLVDLAVAGASAAQTTADCWHLDVQLHQSVLTRIEHADGVRKRVRVIPIPGCGWLAMQDSIANAISDSYIRQTRFDPRRTAATEQLLYDRLGTVLTELQDNSEYNLEVNGHRVRLELRSLIESCDGHYQRLVQAMGDASQTLVIDRSMAQLPGLASVFSQLVAVEPGALAATITTHAEHITSAGDDLHFITSLPLPASAAASMPPAAEPAPPAAPQSETTAQTSPKAAPEPTPATEPVPAPVPARAPQTAGGTHAEPIEPTRCQIFVENGAFTLQPLPGRAPLVNGRAIEGSMQLAPGDLLDLGGNKRWRLTEVEPDDGA